MARTLAADVSATARSITLNSALTTLTAGDLLRLENELVEFRGYVHGPRATPDNTKLMVNRAAKGTTAATHASSTPVYGAREAVITGSSEVRPSAVGIVGGVVALDGSNPTPVTTGLTTILAASATLEGAVAPGDNTSVLTVAISGGTLSIYAWKNTSGTDPTLVASTGTENVHWVAYGI